MSFRVGQRPDWVAIGAKCVFVGTQGMPVAPGAEPLENPQRGIVYTVNWMDRVGHQFCIGLSELDQEACFDVRCFAPVTSQSAEHDISLFNGILDKAMEGA